MPLLIPSFFGDIERSSERGGLRDGRSGRREEGKVQQKKSHKSPIRAQSNRVDQIPLADLPGINPIMRDRERDFYLQAEITQTERANESVLSWCMRRLYIVLWLILYLISSRTNEDQKSLSKIQQ